MKKRYLLALLAGLLCLLCLLCAEASASEGEHEGHAIFPHYNISTKSHLIYCTDCDKIASFGYCSGGSATCTEPGYCEVCLSPYISATGHKMTNYESDNNATCTQDGTKTARCQNDGCGESKTIPDEGSKLEHNFINYTPNGDANCTSVGTRTATCSRCTATDTQPGEGVAPNHNVVSDPAIPPTCTRDGLTAGSHCSRCQEVLTAQNTVARLGHQPVEDAAVAATCTRDGLTAGSHCGRCQEVLTAQNTVAKLGHQPVEDAAVAATCTRDGLTAGSHCSRCQEVLTAQNTVAKLGHLPVEDAAVAATCTRDGLTAGSHCSRCQEVLTAQNSVSNLGHWYTIWTPTGANTHTASCMRSDCTFNNTVDCVPINDRINETDIIFCPICGEASDGVHLPLVEGARVQAGRMPAGELIVRQREGLTSICFVRSGKLSRPYAPATILLPNGESVLFDFVKAALPVLVIK